MTEWTTAAALRAQVRKRWDKGELLAELAASSDLFPLRLALRAPSSADLSARFDEARAWATELRQAAGAGYRIVMREVRHRIIGQNSLPAEVWLDTLDEALRLIGKTREARTFDALLSTIRQRQPALLPWLQRQPLRALELAVQWPQLLAVVAWMSEHPRPGIYPRQIDSPGLHSKFVEAHRGVLSELLDLSLPADAIDAAATGTGQFARRYGLRDKPLRLRFRTLDQGAIDWMPGGDGDYSVSQATFAALAPAVDRVFVTENEINFLAFPRFARSLVVFGAGYGFDVLQSVDWLAGCGLHYWGDIDTHGFAILDQLRARHPHAESFLMDRDTLLAHRAHWTIEPQPTCRELTRLSTEEWALYDDLRGSRLSDRFVRLEQERIEFGRVVEAVQACTLKSGRRPVP